MTSILSSFIVYRRIDLATRVCSKLSHKKSYLPRLAVSRAVEKTTFGTIAYLVFLYVERNASRGLLVVGLPYQATCFSYLYAAY